MISKWTLAINIISRTGSSKWICFACQLPKSPSWSPHTISDSLSADYFTLSQMFMGARSHWYLDLLWESLVKRSWFLYRITGSDLRCRAWVAFHRLRTVSHMSGFQSAQVDLTSLRHLQQSTLSMACQWWSLLATTCLSAKTGSISACSCAY